MRILLLLVLTAALTYSCTKRDAYDIIREAQQHNCSKYEGIHREKCLQGSDITYQEYKAER